MRIDENLALMNCKTDTLYGFPIIEREETKCVDFISFNYAKTSKPSENMGIHFFIDDYQFLRVWRDPMKYVTLLKRFGCALSPDFSLYYDMPRIMQMYNHYRKQFLGAFFQANMIPTVPSVGWSDRQSFEWCFLGLPHKSTVAVSSVGTQKYKDTKIKFLEGYNKMLEILEPSKILFFGSVPSECEGNIVKIESFTDKFSKKKEVK